MACSRFEYVRRFEQHTSLLPGAWIVVRLDGRSFTSFTDKHGYEKPNDRAGLSLLQSAASLVIEDISDVVLAFAQSDEVSFVLKRDTRLYGRRSEKILSTIVSLFSAEFVRLWPEFFPQVRLERSPSFDGRVVLYPTDRTLRDYLAWRQADVHVNNLFNTTFWALVHSGVSRRDAELELSGTSSGEKNEMLFSRFGINYNDVPAIFRKGSVLIRQPREVSGKSQKSHENSAKLQSGEHEDENILGGDGVSAEPQCSRKRRPGTLCLLHEDIIGDAFWKKYPHVLQPSDGSFRRA